MSKLYSVIKSNGEYAGIYCESYDEARELSVQHEGSKIFRLVELKQPVHKWFNFTGEEYTPSIGEYFQVGDDFGVCTDLMFDDNDTMVEMLVQED